MDVLECETKQSIFLTRAAAEKYFMNNNKILQRGLGDNEWGCTNPTYSISNLIPYLQLYLISDLN